MQLISLSFSNTGLNISLQVGDDIFYSNALSGINFQSQAGVGYSIESGGETSNANNCQYLGRITAINGDILEIEASDLIGVTVSVDGSMQIDGVDLFNIYFFFSKNNSANTSSLKGYYGLLSLRNNAIDKAELFNVSAEIVGSSK